MLGPPLAALFGITLWAIWRLWKRGAAWGWTLLLVLSGFTLGFELFTLREYPAYAGPVTIFSALAWLAGTLWLVLASRRAWSRRVGFGLVGLALLIAPFTWSLLTTLNPSPNVALPTAGVGASDRTRATFMTPNQGYLDPAGEAVLAYTLAHTDPEDYLLATNNARGAAPFILETDRAVLTFGGFTGRDNVVDLETFLQMTASGELRFVLGLPQGTPEISRYVLERCTPVELPGLSGDAGLSGEVLYDCAS
jgi:4-amino-4-deoxy-L-arabinose transferase-like glycosyltransferase